MRSLGPLGALVALAVIGCGGGGGGGKSTISTPVITTQPASKTVALGGTTTLSVTASGGSLAYAWAKDGVSLTGSETGISGQATRTLTISSATVDHAGDYTVTVSNTAGSVTSAAATLTVSNEGDAGVSVN